MKFVLYVEGHTEKKALPAFLKRWLDSRLSMPVGVTPVQFNGYNHFLDEAPKKARLTLQGPGSDTVIAVVGLLDLYGPEYPDNASTVEERIAWLTREIEGRVADERFRMHFAVHELEAWLLSQPAIFPAAIQAAITRIASRPEAVDFDSPPAKRLGALYEKHLSKGYKKTVYGAELFSKLDPEAAAESCPRLRALWTICLVWRTRRARKGFDRAV